MTGKELGKQPARGMTIKQTIAMHLFAGFATNQDKDTAWEEDADIATIGAKYLLTALAKEKP